MTKLFEMAIEAARRLAPEEQDELARMILEVVQGAEEDVYLLSDGEDAAIDIALAEVEKSEFASEEDVAALLGKHAR